MRILLVHNFYQQPGGEDAVVRQEMALLQNEGHEVLLFSVHNDDIKGFLRKAATAILTIYNPWEKRRLVAKLAKFRPDIVHVHNIFPQLSPAVFDACREAGVPSVMTLHNFRILCPTSFLYYDAQLRERSLKHPCFWTVKRRVYKNSYIGTFVVACMVEFHKRVGTWRSKVDRFIVLSEFARQKFVEGGLASDRIIIKGNCVAGPSVVENIGCARRGALFVGRLSEEKGLITLVNAWKDLDYPLRIAGDGPLRKLCENSPSGQITYLGRLSQEQVYAEMARAAFLVMPSVWYEMFGLVVIEAYACGLPVLATHLGGLVDLVHESITGLVFEPNNVSSLRKAADWAITHPEKMRQMGRNARLDYEARYTPETNHSALLRIYQDTIAACRDGAASSRSKVRPRILQTKTGPANTAPKRR